MKISSLFDLRIQLFSVLIHNVFHMDLEENDKNDCGRNAPHGRLPEQSRDIGICGVFYILARVCALGISGKEDEHGHKSKDQWSIYTDRPDGKSEVLLELYVVVCCIVMCEKGLFGRAVHFCKDTKNTKMWQSFLLNEPKWSSSGFGIFCTFANCLWILTAK